MSILRVGRSVLDAVRELDLGAIEREVAYPIRVLVAGRAASELDHFVRVALANHDQTRARQHVEILEIESEMQLIVPRGLDLAILVSTRAGELSPEELILCSTLRAYAVPMILVDLEPDGSGTPGLQVSHRWIPDLPADRQVRGRLSETDDLLKHLSTALATLEHHQIAPLACCFEPLRPHLVEVLVRDASRANGQFALISSIPTLIPLVGGIVSSVADFFVLTKNQVMLVFRIAGIYGRDISDRLGLALEIVPVVGGAFLWRSVARSLVALLPGFISAVPKTFVAYVGTYVVGQMAHFYYREGRRPSPEVLDRIRQEGLALAGKFFGRK
ncbi:MAG: hypothetical protein ACKVVP_19455 [Chloroflexota bacterium]